MNGDSLRKRIEALEAQRNTGLRRPRIVVRFVASDDGHPATVQPPERYTFGADGNLELMSKGELG
jgi:hypothetical protein